MTHKNLTSPVWVVTEGIAGTENQCVGVAEHIARDYGLRFDVLRVGLHEPWRTLSPYIKFESARSFDPPLTPPWPKLLITSGRKAIAVSRYIKAQSKGQTKTLHIQDPRVSSGQFDLVAVPHHDPMRGDNVIVTDASPNKITQERLDQSAHDFPHLEQMQRPRIAVLIGGNSKAYTLSRQLTERLAERLSDVEGSLMVTCSRRTGEENRKILETFLDKPPNYFWNGEGENPYFAYLALADYILVTADSASMISEACTTGKPVYMIELDGGAKRIDRLHAHLIEKGCLRIFDGQLETYEYTPLNDARMVADEVKKRFGALLSGDDG